MRCAQLRVRKAALSFCEADGRALAETVSSFLPDARPQFPGRSLNEVGTTLMLMKEQYRSRLWRSARSLEAVNSVLEPSALLCVVNFAGFPCRGRRV
jgi:hypothetical protein